MIDHFQALSFDIDGILVDSTPTVERAWRVWAARHGIDDEQILRICHGRRTENTLVHFVPGSEVEAGVSELESLEMQDLDEITALPGAADLLSQIPESRWAAVTSGPRELMRARLSKAGLPTPRVLVTAEDVIHGKPDPEGYRKAANPVGTYITRCLVLEDAPAGVTAGQAAGAPVVATCTSHDKNEVDHADAVVADLSKLEAWATGYEIKVHIKPWRRPSSTHMRSMCPGQHPKSPLDGIGQLPASQTSIIRAKQPQPLRDELCAAAKPPEAEFPVALYEPGVGS